MAVPGDASHSPRQPWPPAVQWTIGLFTAGLIFQAGMFWQSNVIQDRRLDAHEATLAATQTAIAALQVEIAGLRSDVRILTSQVAQLNRIVYGLPAGVEP